MNSNNIMEINQMIDYLEDFFSNNNTSSNNLVVGGMTGTFLFKYAIEAATTSSPFEKILVVEGCQDYMGFIKNNMNNVVYYADLFNDVLCDPITPYDPFKPAIFNPKGSYHKQINLSRIQNYDCIIIEDGHLIPREFINAIVQNYFGKICIIVDPFDIGGEFYAGVPTITDSLNKLSPILAMARSTYEVDTRAIDKSIKGTVTESKINKRSIGKIDDKQYISNDLYLIDMIRHKQLQSGFRKNQKLLVTSNRINTSLDESKTVHSLANNSMCVIVSPNSRPLMRLRIYSSKVMYYGDVSYLENPPDNMIRVKPANILSVDESAYHRYKTTVLVGNEPVSQRQKYSILKNSNNVIIGRI